MFTKPLTRTLIIFSGQFGFRANHSTEHALLLITDQIQRAIEGGHFSWGIFFDLGTADLGLDVLTERYIIIII